MGDAFTADANHPLYTTPDPPTFNYSSVGKGFMVAKHGVCQVDHAVTGVGQRHGSVIMAVNGTYFGSPDGPGIGVSPAPVRTLAEVFAAPTGTVGDFDLPFGPDESDMEGFGSDEAGGYLERDIGEFTVQTPKALASVRGLWLSEPYDMGFPGNMKIFKSISLETSLEVPITVGVLAARSRYEHMRAPSYYSVGPHRPTTAVSVAGIFHQVMVFCQNHPSGIPFDALTISFELPDKRNLHGYQQPLKVAR